MAPSPAHAALGTLWVDIGGTLCQDNAGCDSNPANGVVVTSSVPLGTVTVNGSTSSSGSPVAALTITTGNTPVSLGSYTLRISDTGFTTPPVPLQLAQDVSGLSGPLNGVQGTLAAKGCFSATNTLFDVSGTCTGIANGTINNLAGVIGGSTSGVITAGTPYALTSVIVVNITQLATGTNKNYQVSADLDAVPAGVPEPAGVALLGGLLVVVAGGFRRKLRRS